MLAVLIFSLLILSLHGGGLGDGRWKSRDYKSGTARTVANSVRVHIRRGEQRFGIRGTQREHGLVQRDARVRHAVGKILHGAFRCWRLPEIWREKKIVPESAGTFPVTTPLFATLLVSVILIVGALTFFPALSLGPILEHLLLHAGKVF